MIRSKAPVSLHISGILSAQPTFTRVGQTYKKIATIYIPYWIDSRWAACLGLASLLALSGCTRLKVKMGQKIYIDKIPISSMQASLPKGPGIAPGEKSPLVVALTQPDGKILRTEGEGHGQVMWKDLQVTTSVVTVNQKGIVSLPQDPRTSDGKMAQVVIAVPSHPDLHAELDIPVRYDHEYFANFSGSKGLDGLNGSDGFSGTSGSMGSFDLNHPSAGGNGSNGSDGSNGQDGSHGGDGWAVTIRLALRSGSHPLLQAAVSSLCT